MTLKNAAVAVVNDGQDDFDYPNADHYHVAVIDPRDRDGGTYAVQVSRENETMAAICEFVAQSCPGSDVRVMLAHSDAGRTAAGLTGVTVDVGLEHPALIEGDGSWSWPYLPLTHEDKPDRSGGSDFASLVRFVAGRKPDDPGRRGRATAA